MNAISKSTGTWYKINISKTRECYSYTSDVIESFAEKKITVTEAVLQHLSLYTHILYELCPYYSVTT
jgi:hypothetical protein